MHLDLREKVLVDIVVNLLANEILSHIGVLVGESQRLHGGTIDRESIVVQQLLINVRSKRSVNNADLLAKVRPRLQVLVVDLLSDSLQLQLGGRRDNSAEETCLNSKNGLQELVNLLLVGVVLISQVVNGTGVTLLGDNPKSFTAITDMDSAHAEITTPQELHLLIQVLVDSSNDDARGDTGNVTRTVDDSRTDDDEGKSVDGL